MQQEDYLKRQIDQLGQVLGKILAGLTGLKSAGQMADAIEAADQAIKEELGLHLKDLYQISLADLIMLLSNSKMFNADNLEKLAGIFFSIADGLRQPGLDGEKRKILYERSLAIYEHIENTSATYSFDRHCMINKIKKTL